MAEEPVTAPSAAVPLLEPADGLPEVVDSPDALAAATLALASGDGPVAVDAERASGYRYGHRAYLVQLRRAGSGTVLVDPVPFGDLVPVQDAIGGVEWVLHAASQDLPSLADLGLRPSRLFDTELAGRLLGYPRVGLGTMVEEVLGLRLEKGHAAVDWSTRPLPDDWLRYAALDVEVLVDLRDALDAQLQEQGKREWAEQEFAAVAAAPTPTPRADPWRRTSGMHRVRTRRGLAAVRALWEARDGLARQRNLAPGRVLPDSAIVSAATTMPRTRDELAALPVFGGRATRRNLALWLAALESARSLSDADLPPLNGGYDGPPPPRSWPDRDPAAAERLADLRPAVAALADEHGLPTENLLAPDAVRRIAWQPPDDLSAEAVAARLTDLGARPWQVEITALPIARALQRLAVAAGAGTVDDGEPAAPAAEPSPGAEDPGSGAGGVN